MSNIFKAVIIDFLIENAYSVCLYDYDISGMLSIC